MDFVSNNVDSRGVWNNGLNFKVFVNGKKFLGKRVC